MLRGESSDGAATASVIEVLDENWNTVAVYQQCGWTLTTITTAGANGVPITAPHYVGIEAREIAAACELLQIPAPERATVALGVKHMVNAAAPLLNRRRK